MAKERFSEIKFLLSFEIEKEVESSDFDEAQKEGFDALRMQYGDMLTSARCTDIQFEKEDLGAYIDYAVIDCKKAHHKVVQKDRIKKGVYSFCHDDVCEHNCSLDFSSDAKICAACGAIIDHGYIMNESNHNAAYCSKACLKHQIMGSSDEEKFLNFKDGLPAMLVKEFDLRRETNENKDKDKF